MQKQMEHANYVTDADDGVRKAIAGKELRFSSWCIALLYIYHFSAIIDFSSEKYSGSTEHRNSWYQQRNFQ